MDPHSSARGVTLLELIVAMAVTFLVISGVVVVVNSQQKAYLEGQRLRGAAGAGRRALLSLEESLPNAGFGMDAALAFDFNGWYSTGPCPAQMGTCPRDAVANSDELVFFARDPRYWVPSTNSDDPVGNAWRISTVTATTLTVFARANDVFRNGQIFLAVCPGTGAYAYFTASQTVKLDATFTGPTQDISLAPVVTSNPFRRQDVAAATACFNSPAIPTTPVNPARLYLVNRYRYHVRPVASGALGATTIYDPMLVLDRGVDVDGDGDVDADDEELVAEGVESMQVSYVFYSGAITPAGATAGTALTLGANTAAAAGTAADTVTTTLFPGAAPPSGQTIYATSSFYPYTFGPPPANERNTNHQANIQAVRVSLLARSQEIDTRSSQRTALFLPLLNQNAVPAWVSAYANALGGHDGFQRVVLDTTVALPNMGTRAMTYF